MKSKGLKMESLLSSGKDPFKGVQWKRVKVDSLVSRAPEGIEVPSFWSATAAEIVGAKYLRSKNGSEFETSLRELLRRVTKALKKTAQTQKFFASSQDLNRFLYEIEYIVLHQMASFNSPVWFNVGLFESYRLKSFSEHWTWDFRSKKVRPVQNALERPQCSACFIQSVDDSLEGIFDLIKNEARLFKYGSGSGTNFSSLRSKYEEINVGGTSSGLISFLEVLDKGAGAIKSGGTTRRAAKMVLLDDDHPELLDFIEWKVEEERKAQALIKAGYSGGMEGAAYKTVSGQNSNNSVRISNKFMDVMNSGGEWALTSRKSGKVVRRTSAQDIWSRLSKAAWSCADPGVQFTDTIQDWHTCSQSAPIRGSNPCSEYLFLDDSACNLASLNLIRFFNPEGHFELEKYLHVARVMLIAQEILVDYSSYPTQKIAQNSHDYRPLGLGFANLGSLLTRLGLGYDSDEGREWATVLTALLTGQAYRTSAEMASFKGPFPQFKKNRKSMMRVIQKHYQAVQKVSLKSIDPQIFLRLQNVWEEGLLLGKKFGFRNAQTTVIAPTGTIGLMMDCDTFGIEPDFSLFKTKILVGGGELTLVNQAVEAALWKLGYSATQVQGILKTMNERKSLQGLVKKDHEKVFETATGTPRLRAESHLLMMAAVQPFISGAISKTVNLPESATAQEIGMLYHKAWQLGLKSVAIYRDNSKGSQPLMNIECLDC